MTEEEQAEAGVLFLAGLTVANYTCTECKLLSVPNSKYFVEDGTWRCDHCGIEHSYVEVPRIPGLKRLCCHSVGINGCQRCQWRGWTPISVERAACVLMDLPEFEELDHGTRSRASFCVKGKRGGKTATDWRHAVILSAVETFQEEVK